jgi:fatty-acyl-CoA synthase
MGGMPTSTGEQSNYVAGALELFTTIADREAIVEGARRLNFADVSRSILIMAGRLDRAGVRPGSAALIMVGNVADAPILQLALHLLGCRSMWIAPVTAQREIQEFVQLAHPDLFIYDSRNKAEIGRQLSESLPGVPVFCLGPDGAGPDLTAPATPGEAGWDPATPVPAPESFLQTSGTTGTPKLVHHQEGFYAQILTLGRQFIDAGLPVLRHLSHSPMWLASGQITSLFNLFTGGVLFLREDWDPAAFLQIVPAERINSTFVSPPMLYEVLDHPQLAEADFSSMFMFNVGAGPAAPSRLRQAIARFGPVLRIVYGLSEAVVITAYPGLTEDPEHPQRLRSAGLPYGDVRLEIRAGENGTETDPDLPFGTPLPAGEIGEVWVSSKLSFSGYYGQPELTTSTIRDGWVRTRDVGYLDEDGYLYLVDRVHDMIVTHRRNWAIFCRPIEDALAEHPEVLAAAVIGVPDEVVGEVPHAYVVRAEPSSVGEAELIELVTSTLNEMWAPHAVEFVERLPVNRSNKVDKQALRARWASEHAAARVAAGSSG